MNSDRLAWYILLIAACAEIQSRASCALTTKGTFPSLVKLLFGFKVDHVAINEQNSIKNNRPQIY